MKRFELGLGAALLGSAACFALVSGEAAPAAGAASRTVTITLADTGKGRWSINGDAQKGSLAVNYSWKATLRFKVPAKAFTSTTSRFLAGSSATMRADWTGDATGTKIGQPFNGAYHCSYKGKNVPGKVTASLTNGTRGGTIVLTLHARGDGGFFPSRANGGTAECSTGFGAEGPAHFEPEWLFRDTTSDHARMTSDTAVIDLPRSALKRGTVQKVWPREVGGVDSALRDKLTWNNVGKLVIKTS
jgi:hypothetical protein